MELQLKVRCGHLPPFLFLSPHSALQAGRTLRQPLVSPGSPGDGRSSPDSTFGARGSLGTDVSRVAVGG